MIIRGLGTIGVIHGGDLTRLQPAQKKILAVLIAAGPDGLSSDHFAEAVWGDSLPPNWESAVRQAISRMRRAVGLSTIINSTRHYALASDTNVDVWTLLSTPGSTDLMDAETVTLLAGEPYPAVEHSQILRTSVDRITTERVALIDRCRRSGHPIPGHLLEASRDLLLQQPNREDVLKVVTDVHLAAGLSSQAARILDEGIVSLRAVGPVGKDLLDLSTKLAGLQTGDSPAHLAKSAVKLVGLVDQAPGVQVINRSALLAEAKAALDRGGLVVTGESGSGKTTLARILATAIADEGSHVVWLTGQRDQSAAYGPMLATLPWMESDLRPLLTDGGDMYTRSTCWSASLDGLGRHFPDRRIVLFVDDFQWLDSHSEMFLEFIIAGRTARNLAVVAVGRQTDAAGGARGTLSSLIRSGFGVVDVADFSAEELIDLIGVFDPSSTSKQRVDLAAALVEARATLPAVAHELLRSSERSALTSTSSLTASGLDIWTDRVSKSTQVITSAAAVVGLSFRLGRVAQLAGATDSEVLAAVDELLDAELIVAAQRPDEFSFRHLLIQESFAGLLDRGTERQMHLDASAGLEPHDPHRRARHMVEAGPLVSVEDLTDALVASARAYQEKGSFREAAQAYAKAFAVDPHILDGRLLLEYANSLDFSGADGSEIRSRAFAVAQSGGDHELSLEVAIGGAHATEVIDGDERRSMMLGAVVADKLGADKARLHQVELARELSLLGQHERAMELSELAMRAADSAQQRCAGWFAAWPTYLKSPPFDWPPFPVDRDQLEDPDLRARMLHAECVRALMVGDDKMARDLLDQCLSRGLLHNPVRVWFVSLVQAVLACLDGDWERSDEIADAGLAGAQRAGISSAFSARTAQVFAQRWICGRHVELLPMLESAAPDVQQSMLAETAHAVALAADPERAPEAEMRVAHLGKQVSQSRSHAVTSVAALLASTPSTVRDAALDELLFDVLEPFAGTSLFIGTGVASLGPATRALSSLAGSPDQQIDLLSTAVEESDRWNLRAWSVRCRLDLEKLVGGQRLSSEARDLASGTDLIEAMFGG